MAAAPLVLDVNDSTDTRIGAHGITAAELDGLEPAAARIHDELMRRRREGRLDFWDLPSDDATQREAIAMGQELGERFETVVVLGIGGSSLGAKAAVAALGGPFHNYLPRSRRRGARIFFPDNSDPATFAGLLSTLDLSTTGFVAITKSGSTAETLSQLMVLRDRLGAEALASRLLVITDPAKGTLRQIAEAEGWRTLPVPPGVGGRYSVLSAVGLVPIAAGGFDASELCRGADRMRIRCEAPALRENPAWMLGGLHRLFDAKGRKIHVLFPYADSLREMGDWFVQLWAESLGKSEAVGPTPLRAVGATDQHSLLQLLMEGPQDKLVTFVAVEEPAEDVMIPPAWPGHDALDYLGGKRLGELIDAERRGTAAALAEAGRPSLTIRLPRIDAASVGGFFFLWEAATAFAGLLYGVDPFDQPGVEASKKITQALLGRKGFEAHAEALGSQPALDPRLILGA